MNHADTVLKEVAAKLEGANAGTKANIDQQRIANQELANRIEAALSSLATGAEDIRRVVLANEQTAKNARESAEESAKVAERMHGIQLSLDGLANRIQQLVHVDQIEHEAFIQAVDNLIEQLAGNAKQVD